MNAEHGGHAEGAPVAKWSALVAFAALAALHLHLGREMSLPIILGDEFGYLANAAYFAGFEWSGVLVGVNYYSFGYSLLLTPWFLLFDDPFLIYRAALAVNAVAAAAIVFPALHVARRLLPQTGRWTRLAVVVATCLYPSYVVFTNLSWAESVFALVFWLVAALFCRLQDATAPAWLAGLAALAVAYLYAVHPRGLTVIVAATLVILGAVALDAWPRRRAAWYLALLVPALCAAEWVRHLLIERLWLGHAVENSYTSVGARIGTVFSFDGLKRLVLETVGQSYYLLLATYGLVIVGLVVVGRLTWRSGGGQAAATLGERLRRHLRWDAAFLWLAFLLSFLLSVGFEIEAKRADQWLYGRYNEGVAGPFILLGLGALVVGGRRFRGRALLLLASLLTIAVVAPALGMQQVIDAADPAVHANITGLFPYRSVDWKVDFLIASVNVLATAAVLVAALRLRREIGIALVAGVFLWAGVSNIEDLYARAAALRGQAVEIDRWFEEHDPAGDVVQFQLWSPQAGCGVYRYVYQLLLPERTVVPVQRIRRGLTSGGPALVITCGYDPRDWLPRARPLASEPAPPLTLWVLDSGLREAARPTHPELTERLPTTAYRSRLATGEPAQDRVVDRDLSGLLHLVTKPRILRRLRHLDPHLDVEVTNVSPLDWPQTVRVGILWFDAENRRVAEHRAYLRGALASGESQRVRVPLVTPLNADLLSLPAGDYTVKIGLVHERVTWFFSHGDSTLDFQVELE